MVRFKLPVTCFLAIASGCISVFSRQSLFYQHSIAVILLPVFEHSNWISLYKTTITLARISKVADVIYI